MPTVKPRITVTLDHKTYEIFAKYARLQGKTKGSSVAEILSLVAPFMVTPIKVMEKAASAPDSVKSELSELFQEVEKDILGAFEKAGQGDLFTGKKH